MLLMIVSFYVRHSCIRDNELLSVFIFVQYFRVDLAYELTEYEPEWIIWKSVDLFIWLFVDEWVDLCWGTRWLIIAERIKDLCSFFFVVLTCNTGNVSAISGNNPPAPIVNVLSRVNGAERLTKYVDPINSFHFHNNQIITNYRQISSNFNNIALYLVQILVLSSSLIVLLLFILSIYSRT